MLKNKRGISLTTMVITVMVMLIVMGTLVYSAVDSVKVRKLNKLYNDLRQLDDAVEIYYLKTGILPIDTSKTAIVLANGATGDTLKDLEFLLKDGVTTVSNQNSFINPNDYDTSTSELKATYEYINLGLLENLSLNYPDNVYLVNTQSHTVYNLTGVKIDNVLYHSLPLKYKDVNYKENNPVTASLITLKQITGTTSGTNLYYPVGSGELNVRDLLSFGTGEPKEVTFSVSSNSYITVGEKTGIIKAVNGIDLSTMSPNAITLRVDVTNYKANAVYKNFNVYPSEFAVVKTETSSAISTVNVAANRSTNLYSIVKYGYLSGRNPGFTITPADSSIGNATVSSDTLTFTGSKYGSTDIVIKSNNFGLASHSIKLNVFDFDVYKGAVAENVTNLVIGGVGDNDTVDLMINAKGGEGGLTFSDGTNNTNNTVDWELVKPHSTNAGEYEPDSSTTVASIPTYTAGEAHEHRKITITPKETGTTYLRYTIKIDDIEIKTGIITVNVVGNITATGLTTTDRLAIDPDTKKATLTYNLDSSVTPTGATVSYSCNSDNTNFKVNETETSNQFEIEYDGPYSTSSADITITATVTNNGTTSTYSDKVTLTYTPTIEQEPDSEP